MSGSEAGGDGPAPMPATPTTEATPAPPEGPIRRLSDKVRAAMQQAAAQGRRELAERLKLVHQAIVEEEDAYPEDRRGAEGE